MLADVVGDFAATGRVSDVDGVAEVEMCGQGRQVVGVVGVVIVPMRESSCLDVMPVWT
jgi:hypothetical protein